MLYVLPAQPEQIITADDRLVVLTRAAQIVLHEAELVQGPGVPARLRAAINDLTMASNEATARQLMRRLELAEAVAAAVVEFRRWVIPAAGADPQEHTTELNRRFQEVLTAAAEWHENTKPVWSGDDSAPAYNQEDQSGTRTDTRIYAGTVDNSERVDQADPRSAAPAAGEG